MHIDPGVMTIYAAAERKIDSPSLTAGITTRKIARSTHIIYVRSSSLSVRRLRIMQAGKR
jgi:hypothetical protein